MIPLAIPVVSLGVNTLSALGASTVIHSSGAALVYGAGGYIAGTMSAATTAALVAGSTVAGAVGGATTFVVAEIASAIAAPSLMTVALPWATAAIALAVLIWVLHTLLA